MRARHSRERTRCSRSAVSTGSAPAARRGGSGPRLTGGHGAPAAADRRAPGPSRRPTGGHRGRSWRLTGGHRDPTGRLAGGAVGRRLVGVGGAGRRHCGPPWSARGLADGSDPPAGVDPTAQGVASAAWRSGGRRPATTGCAKVAHERSRVVPRVGPVDRVCRPAGAALTVSTVVAGRACDEVPRSRQPLARASAAGLTRSERGGGVADHDRPACDHQRLGRQRAPGGGGRRRRHAERARRRRGGRDDQSRGLRRRGGPARRPAGGGLRWGRQRPLHRDRAAPRRRPGATRSG